MNHLATLREKALACPQAPDQATAVFKNDIDACPDRIAVDTRPIADELQLQKAVRGNIRGISHEPNPRGVAVAQPEIEIAIVIPINLRHATRVIEKIEPAHRRGIGELATTKV